jgi:hypothetical protein
MKVIEHKYHKIKAFGDDENKDLLLFPEDEIVIEEKLDGANFRFIIKNGVLYFGTHSNDITPESEKDWLRCMNYIRSNINLDNATEGWIYYGECMKKHTLNYDWENTPPFLGFDIMDIKTEKYLNEPWHGFADINLPFVPIKRITLASAIELPITDDYVPISQYAPNKSSRRRMQRNSERTRSMQLMIMITSYPAIILMLGSRNKYSN